MFLKQSWFTIPQNDLTPVIINTLGALCIIILVFLLIREVTLWYFRINKIVSLLESIDSKLDRAMQNNASDDVVVPNAKIVNAEHVSDLDKGELDIGLDCNNIKAQSDTLYKYETKSFSEKIEDILMKEYYISDLFSSRKKRDKEL